MEKIPTYGRITVAPEALRTVVRLTALAVPGVVRLTPPTSLKRMLGLQDGFQVTVEEGVVQVDLHVVAESGHNILNLCRQIQSEVARAIEEMVGLTVESVDVYIEDVIPAPKSEDAE